MRTTAARAARKAAANPPPAPPLLQLAVRVQPGASASEVTVADAAENLLQLSARVTARAHDGEANDALRRLLADCLGVSRSRVSIVRGLKSRDKVVAVDGMTRDDVLAVLGTET
ncbi:DUF167-domain-containing protein [Auricularia subglabra TFB-10046 SS5]|nr:DUF167-domain-containing protein [Auricularia subglabra TFB-10046 SS5]